MFFKNPMEKVGKKEKISDKFDIRFPSGKVRKIVNGEKTTFILSPRKKEVTTTTSVPGTQIKFAVATGEIVYGYSSSSPAYIPAINYGSFESMVDQEPFELYLFSNKRSGNSGSIGNDLGLDANRINFFNGSETSLNGIFIFSYVMQPYIDYTGEISSIPVCINPRFFVGNSTL